ncbi:MAG: YggT family protein [Candidatus Krumholzibacteria bacterium]|nr:YggT family protein [Candidatus Krumholzibacteria bacterium]
MLRFVASVTEPVLAPVRSFTQFGSLDLSPIVVIVAVQLIIGMLRG